MKPTPIKKEIVDTLIESLGIKDFAKATIREVKQVAAKAEKESGVEYIKMEMGIPGLPAAQVGVDAQIKALQDGIAHSYPDIQGYPELKKQASRFVKAFINVDIAPEGCVPVCGSCLFPHLFAGYQGQGHRTVYRPRFPCSEDAAAGAGREIRDLRRVRLPW